MGAKATKLVDEACPTLPTQVSEDEDYQLCSLRLVEWFRRPQLLLLGDAPEDHEGDCSSLSSTEASPCAPYYYRRETSSPTEESSSRWSSRSTSWLSLSEYDYTEAELLLSERPIPESDLRGRRREIWIVTTAALPWMTGTAVNPLLRAAVLTRSHSVTLVVPWLESADDRVALYGGDWRTADAARQEQYIRDWLQQAGYDQASEHLQLDFYPARYHAGLSSIFAMGDLCDRLQPVDYDSAVCILEEPEHVNFYRAPGRQSWRDVFPHVIGIVHTNYKAYARHHYSGLVTGPLVGAMSSWMVRAYCDKVIKLSSVLQEYAMEKETTSNVHGIRKDFLAADKPVEGIYFIGKLLFAKGLDKMLELQSAYRRVTGKYFAMDIYGSGPEEKEIQRAFLGDHDNKERSYYWRKQQPMPVEFKGRVDHAQLSRYKIFINPSLTEVLCTTTAEALAMGKFVIVPNHPSNVFFQQFPNCLQYNGRTEFCHLLQYALGHEPEPLSDELRYTLTWEAATERLYDAAAVSERDAARRDRVGRRWDERLSKLHYELGRGPKGDFVRKVLGGGPVADQHKYQYTLSKSVSSSSSSADSEVAPAPLVATC